MTSTYISTSQAAQMPGSLFWLEKETKAGRTTIQDIKHALDEYERSFTSGTASKAEIMTLHRAFPDSPTYTEAATILQKKNMVEPLVIGGPASVELIDREGHLITTGALDKAFKKFMDNPRTRNVMVLHSDVQIGWGLPAYISRGGQIFKSGVDDKGLFFICELRDDTAISKKVAEQINQGVLKSYSIAGSALKIQNMKKGLTPYMQVDEMELAEVTVCEKGVNQGAGFEILKAELPQTGKIDKDQCGYRDATGPEMAMGISCGHCKYFNAEQRTCDVVIGDIMPGDYCKLFEASGKGDTPHDTVHRKIVIMRSDNTGKIDFTKSFFDWLTKEEDPLKSGKSFTTLNNFAGREAEHHRLLQEYGFPSEPSLDSMRYVPVVETETDDDGKPINIIPPWVVNEAGQDLGDKLDEDAPSFKKSLEILENILQKGKGERWRKKSSSTPTEPTPSEPPDKPVDKANGTPLPPPRNTNRDITEQTPTSLGQELGVGKLPPPRTEQMPPYNLLSGSKVPGPVPGGQPPATGRTPEGLQTDYGPQEPKFRGQRSFSPTPEQPEKRPGVLQRLGQQFRGRGTDPTAKPSSEQPPTGGPRKTDRPIPQAVQDRKRERGWQKVGRQAGEAFEGGRPERERLGENIRSGTKRMGELFGRGKERAKAGMKEARAQLGDVAAGWRGDEIAGESRKYRMDKDPETGKRTKVDLARGRTAYKLGRLGRRGGERGVAGAKAGARGAKEFGAGVGEGFTSYDRDARTFDREKAGGGASRGARRIGRMFGATGRGTGEAIGEGTRMAAQEGGRFGRGVARGATPGQTGSNWRDREAAARRGDVEALPDVRGTTPRSASERFGQWLGGQGRERTADVLDTTGQTARGFGRGVAPGEWGKRLRADEAASDKDRTWGEKLGQFAGVGTRGTGRQAGNVGTRVGRNVPKVGSGARRGRAEKQEMAQQEQQMMQQEGVGGNQLHRPAAHNNLNTEEIHRSVGNLVSGINQGKDLSPKQWMEAIHYLSSDKKTGDRNAEFSIDMNSKDWNTPVSFADMQSHFGNTIQAHHGPRGDRGARAFDRLKSQLASAASPGGEKIDWGEIERPTITSEDDDYRTHADPPNRRGRERERPPNRRERRGPLDEYERNEERRREADVDMSLGKMAQYNSEEPVTNIFKRAFKITTSRSN